MTTDVTESVGTGTESTHARPLPSDQPLYYRGLRMMPYDLLREGLIALLGVAIVTFGLAIIFSSPDEPPLTIQGYAQQDPAAFVTTAMGELSGSGGVAQYGPPYNQGTDSVQSIGPVSLQTLAGVTNPIDVSLVYVLDPLTTSAQTDPAFSKTLQTFTTASAKQQGDWEDAYTQVLTTATVADGHVGVAAGDYGPIPAMMDRLLTLGTSSALDGLLLRSGRFYQNDFTKPLLFLSEDALPAKAKDLNLLGSQWGAMNETGNYPGQAWLWLYTFWYQVPPYNTAANADLLIMLTMVILTAILVFLPFIPFLNRLPYYLGVHRVIWREYYRDVRGSREPTSHNHTE